MQVKQIYEILNDITKEVMGKEDLVQEDLSNIVDVGSEIMGTGQADNYVKKLMDRISRVVFVARNYESSAPKIFMDSWEFGSIVEKVRCNILTAKENHSWELNDGETYPAHVFYKPNVSVKFWNSKTTFDVPVSFSEITLKESFNSVSELNSFYSMIYNAVEQTLIVMSQSLAMRTISTLIALKLDKKETKKSGVVHLITDYNKITGRTETESNKMLHDKDFLRYVAEQVLLVSSRMKTLSTNYNISESDCPVFTSQADQKLILIDQLATDLNVYLQSDTYHDEYTKIGTHDVVPFWQGSGANNYALEDITSIDIKHEKLSTQDKTLKASNIVGLLFDKYACGITQFNRRTTSEYTASSEFFTNYNKQDANYFVDVEENAVVFCLD